MIIWTNLEVAGLLPEFLSEHDPRPAVEQFNENYQHGGGWNPMKGFKLKNDPLAFSSLLSYPGDRDLREVSRCKLRDETIILFDCEFVAVVQPDGSFQVARMS